MSNPVEPEPPAAAIAIAERPHMEAVTIAFLEERLKAASCYLEYGSGGSTRMAIKSGVPFVFSVESDLAYAQAVRAAVSQDIGTNIFRMSSPDLGATGRWGYPTTTEKSNLWWKYPTEIWTMIRAQNVTPDLILIDGRFRVACFFASLLQAKPGTVIVFDDFLGRQGRYGGAAAALPIREMAGRAAIFEVPEVVDYRFAAFELARYCAVRF